MDAAVEPTAVDMSEECEDPFEEYMHSKQQSIPNSPSQTTFNFFCVSEVFQVCVNTFLYLSVSCFVRTKFNSLNVLYV